MSQSHPKIRLDKRQVPLIWVFISTTLSCLLLTGMAIGYVTYAIHKSNQQWCELITYYDDIYKRNPPNPNSPTYDIQRKNAELMHRRRINLGCN